MFLNGAQPSSEDKQLFNTIKQYQHEALIVAEKYPKMHAWLQRVASIDEATRDSWQANQASHPSIQQILQVLTLETEEEAEKRRAQQQWDNYIPPSQRRPIDEFYDVQSVEKTCKRGPEDISVEKDGQFIKYVVEESKSKFNRLIDVNDTVHYIHETRYDNGQLVDFEEKRKAKEKFEMANLQQHEHLRFAFLTMKKGEIAWFNIGPKYHGNIYHNYCKRDHIASDAVIGDRIWIRLKVENIKRQPIYKDNQTWAGKCEYLATVKELCKELMAEEEYTNAQQLYSRVLGEFKNLPKKIHNTLSEEQKEERIKIMTTLNTNISLVHFKRKQASESIKKAKEAIELSPNDVKAHYRLAMGHKLNNDLEQAREAIKEAVRLEPNNELIRKEFKELSALKNQKEKEWYSKMNGFLFSDKMKKIEKDDTEQEKLKFKVRRKCLERRKDSTDEEMEQN